MNRASIPFLAAVTLIAILAFGCQRSERAATNSVPQETLPQGGSAAPETREPDAAPSTKATPGPSAVPSPNAASPGAPAPSTPRPAPKKPFVIVGQGKDGWQPASLTAEALGSKIDQATRELKGAKAESHLLVENAELSGEISAKIAIQDRGLYRIEYQLPNKPTDTHLLVGKNGKKYTLSKERWKPGPAQSAQVDDAKLVAQWPQDFTYRLFQPFETDARVWQRLLGSLAKGVGGYKATVEQRTLPVDGRQVPFYRVLAQRQGPRPTTIEMRFEGNRFVPLVVKINQMDAQGRPNNVQWQAGWSFGKSIDPKEIQVPGE